MKRESTRIEMTVCRWLVMGLGLLAPAFLASCSTMSGGSSGSSQNVSGQIPASKFNHPAVQARNAEIRNEAPGDYYIGRRWWVNGTRFWGYLRRPGQTWDQAKLVIMNESTTKQPDRVPEENAERVHGFDHNYEYRIWGNFTGKTIYDPNSNFALPEFRLGRYELIHTNPGFVFHPGENYNPNRLPPQHPPFPGT